MQQRDIDCWEHVFYVPLHVGWQTQCSEHFQKLPINSGTAALVVFLCALSSINMQLPADLFLDESLLAVGNSSPPSHTTATAGSVEPCLNSIHNLLAEFWPLPLHETFVSQLLEKINGEGIYTLQDLARLARSIKEKNSLALQILDSLQANMLRFNKIKFADLLAASSAYAGDQPKDHFIVLKSSPTTVSPQSSAATSSIVNREFMARRIREWCTDCSPKNKHGVPVVRDAFLEADGRLKDSVLLSYPDAHHVSVRCELCSRSYELQFDPSARTLSLHNLTRHVLSAHATAVISDASDASSLSASSPSPKKRKAIQTQIKSATTSRIQQPTTVTPPPPPLAVPSLIPAAAAEVIFLLDHDNSKQLILTLFNQESILPSSVAPNAPDTSRF